MREGPEALIDKVAWSFPVLPASDAYPCTGGGWWSVQRPQVDGGLCSPQSQRTKTACGTWTRMAHGTVALTASSPFAAAIVTTATAALTP